MNKVLQLINADRRKNVNASEFGRNCLKCGEVKAWDQFITDKRGFNKKTADCRSCRSIKFRKHYRDNPEVRRSGLKNRPDKLKKLYGVTYEQVEHTLRLQDHKCANTGCRKYISLEIKGNTPHRAVIDHCHVSGKFRGLLCVKCNFDLGMVDTDKARIIGLLEYESKFSDFKINYTPRS